MDSDLLSKPADPFVERHIGPTTADTESMLGTLGLDSLDTLVEAVVPRGIRTRQPLLLSEPEGERRLLAELEAIAGKNHVYRSYIGAGYHEALLPGVIRRNVLENPGWYTQYTPYQAEIAQGRLEALINFQTLITELTALPVANASLLDEGTAAAEAMAMCWAKQRRKRSVFLVDSGCHPQTRAVVATRARPLGIRVMEGDPLDPATYAAKTAIETHLIGALVQYPASDGRIVDFSPVAERLHAAGAFLVTAADPLALVLLRPPGKFGADIAVGSSQRFGVPMMAGGPHAGYISCHEELERLIPGRIVGVSRDAQDNAAFRLALQTREQHIRRGKATSNICTAQVLPAILATMYAVYHGPQGLGRIAGRVHDATCLLATALKQMGLEPTHWPVFDTLRLDLEEPMSAAIHREAAKRQVNLRDLGSGSIGVSLDESVERPELETLIEIFSQGVGVVPPAAVEGLANDVDLDLPELHKRNGAILEQQVFNSFHSEHEMLRYLNRLERRDLSLTHSMIPLGSCTMKLNATAEMIPVTWPEFGAIHPFAPAEQQTGYRQLIGDLERWLADLTGMSGVSVQPNAGSQGELAGLLVIRGYLESRGDSARNVCLIPTSAHGTNPASAVMAGFEV
ncbi:MAG: glycine dehydrogenase, partial [Acidobacteriota bacterium]|nr:glycine dehydrogenase [Acidobacteriota bacterium]